MKKIIGLALAAVLVLAMVAGGTMAYFSDTETSTSNNITAGTLDLTWNGNNDQGEYVFQISAANGYPSNNGTAYKLLQNVGSFSGELDVQLGSILNVESTGSGEYLADVIGGGGVGELGAQAKIRVWIDKAGDGAAFTDTTDIVLLSNGTTSTAVASYNTAQDTINNYAETWNAAATMAASDQWAFVIDWLIPSTADNTIQGDSVAFTVTFTLEQASVD